MWVLGTGQFGCWPGSPNAWLTLLCCAVLCCCTAVQVKERAVQKANWPGGGGPKVRTREARPPPV
jgi:hypothetical protein